MRVSAITLVLISASVATLDAQQPVWRTSIGDDFQRIALTTTGQVIVQSKMSTSAVSADSGKNLWFRDDITELSPLADLPFAVARIGNTRRVIDLRDGKAVWDLGALSLNDPVRFVPLPERGLLFVYGPSGASKMTLVAATIDSGVVRWRQDSLLSGDQKLQEIAKHARPVMVGDSIVVLDVDEGGLVGVRLADGKVLWRVTDAVLDLDKVAAPLRLIDGTLYVPYERTLAAIDPATGALRWKKTRDFPGVAERLASSSAGLVVGAAFMHVGWSNEPRIFLDVIDPATGTSRWPKAIEIKGASPFVVRGDTIFQPVHAGFRAIEPASGKMLVEREVSPFGGGEEPALMEEVGDGDFVLLSSQNLMKVDPEGREKYHYYLKPPGSSLLAKAAAVSFSVALSAASGMPAWLSLPTHHASRNENQFAYIFADGLDLIRFDKRDGTEKGRVHLAERTPKYVVDPLTGYVIAVSGHEIAAHHF